VETRGRLWRMIKILTLIQGNNRLKARDLAERCHVSQRTVYRDINHLCNAGIPLYFDKGYKVAGDFFLPPLHLNFEEAIALVVAATAVREQFHLGEAVKSALEKVLLTIPRGARQLAAEVGERIRVDPQPFEPGPGRSPVLQTLEKALLQKKRVCITYYSFHSGETTDREVDPYGLMFRERAWYLVGHCHLRQEVKMFRVERILNLQVLEQQCEPPADFSLDGYMAGAWGVERGEEREVAIHFRPPVARLIKEVKWHPSQQLEELKDGSVVMTVHTGSHHEIARWVVGFGSNASVLQPEELRMKVLEIAKGCVSANDL